VGVGAEVEVGERWDGGRAGDWEVGERLGRVGERLNMEERWEKHIKEILSDTHVQDITNKRFTVYGLRFINKLLLLTLKISNYAYC
jgi:hypothetical protein